MPASFKEYGLLPFHPDLIDHCWRSDTLSSDGAGIMVLVDVILPAICEDDLLRTDGTIQLVRGNYLNKLFPPALIFLR